MIFQSAFFTVWFAAHFILCPVLFLLNYNSPQVGLSKCKAHQSLCYLHTQSKGVDEDLDQNFDLYSFGYVNMGVYQLPLILTVLLPVV